MRCFLLFMGDGYYPAGGWSDYAGSYASAKEAIAVVPEKRRELNVSENNYWWHVVDMRSEKIVHCVYGNKKGETLRGADE